MVNRKQRLLFVAVFAASFLFIFGAARLALPPLMDIDEAITYIEECRDIHIDWANFLTDYPDYDCSEVGDAEWHLMWVERYNKTLDVLYATRRLAQLFDPF